MHLLRYRQAMQRHLEKFLRDPERDARHATSLPEGWRRHQDALEKQEKADADAVDERLRDMRGQIEELRVSFYALELKTPYPIS